MIVVVADDLSGAAEVAGAGWDAGLTAEVQLEFDSTSPAELVVVDTDTRGTDASLAASQVRRAVQEITQSRPAWIFKKVDSILRGWVADELRALLAAIPAPRALLVPANPSRGRIIRNGQFFIDEQLLPETIFAADPMFPRKTALAVELLGADQGDIHLLELQDELPAHGLAVATAEKPAELQHWARCLDETTVPAGAVEFFQAVLAEKSDSPIGTAGHVAHHKPPGPVHCTLFVCGSQAAWSARRKQCASQQVPAVVMPPELFTSDSDRLVEAWTATTVDYLDHHPIVMTAIGAVPPGNTVSPGKLVKRLAELVERVMEIRPPDRLCLEGGATAAAIIRRLNGTRLAVTSTYGPGIVELEVIGQTLPRMVIKPGSYHWPDSMGLS